MFLNDSFLLDTSAAERLYFEYAQPLPIYDFHTHLSPALIADDHSFHDLTELWLDGDHYKWRAMRANGVSEEYCTGNASPWEKFFAWAKTVPHTLRNPLYHWTHLELKFPFGIRDMLLDETSAADIYQRCSELLKDAEFSAQGILRKFNVAVVCTTDDPTDSLDNHLRYQNTGKLPHMFPTWRPDSALVFDSPEKFNHWVNRLAEVSNIEIAKLDDFITALKARHKFFHDAGCRIADHGLSQFPAYIAAERDAESAFSRLRSGQGLTASQSVGLRGHLLVELARMNARQGWAQQFHIGALRNTNGKAFDKIGPDSGFDSIGDELQGAAMRQFLDRLESDGSLTKTVLYNLNPRDSALLATMIGNFQDGIIPGKMQYGAAWWFLDQRRGIESQLNMLSEMGLLSHFIGMVTDSRSFLSYSRHEYFRRILCSLLGKEMASGLLPMDFRFIGELVERICFWNAKNYFNLPKN